MVAVSADLTFLKPFTFSVETINVIIIRSNGGASVCS